MKTERSKNVFLYVFLVFITFIMGLLSTYIGERIRPSREWPWRELRAVEAVTHAVLSYEVERGLLPASLQVLDEDIGFSDGFVLEMFIYVASPVSSLDMPRSTPIVLFPFSGAVVIGRVDGEATFRVGGYPSEDPHFLYGRIGFLQSLLGLVIFASSIVFVVTWVVVVKRPLMVWHVIIVGTAFWIMITLNMRLFISG